MTLSMLASLSTHGQAPRPERLETCRTALVVSGEHYDIAGARGGNGGALDWIGCAAGNTVYTAGAGSYSVADSRWSIARGGASLQPRETLWVAAEMSAGKGRNAAGSFDYLSTRESVTAKPRDWLFARVEHQYLDIATDHGNVFKIAAIVQPVTPLLVELGLSRSAGGNLGTRNHSARIDWVSIDARLFAGAVRGRTTPQAVDIVTGGRLPDAVSRQWFAGSAFTVARGELTVAFDELRGENSRRRTFSVSLRWPLS